MILLKLFSPSGASPRRRAIAPSWEALEARRLLTVAPADLLAGGFAPVTWHGQAAYAKAGQWVVELANIHGSPVEQLAAANAALAKVDGDLAAVRALGGGQFEVRSPVDDSRREVRDRLDDLGKFRHIEPDFALWTDAAATDPDYAGRQWDLNNTGQTGGTPGADISAPKAWDITRGDGSVVVGVIDSGVDYTHPDLAKTIWTNPGEIPGDGIDNDGDGYVDDVHGWDFYNNDNDPMDDLGHGTHVAGTIAATADNGVGIAGIANVQIMPLKFLAADGNGTVTDAIAAINYATMMRRDYGVNIRVTNNSWGGGDYSSALRDAVAANRDAGELFVTAAGNGGPDGVGDNTDTTGQYPANFDVDNILSVAATDASDGLGYFSNYGAKTVDLATPGVRIYSTLRGGGWGYMSGTSMATPHVTGAAALAFSLRPDTTVSQVRAALLAGVDSLPSLAGKTVTGGRLNAYRTLQLLAPNVPTAPAAPTGLQATALSATGIKLAWADASTDETGFLVERSADGVTFAPAATLAANVTTYTDAGLTAATKYTYRVRAVNAVGTSAASNVAAATTASPPVAQTVTPPAAPTGLKAAATSGTSVVLSWADASANETGFKIERSTDGVTFTQIGTVGANIKTYASTGLTAGKAYTYRVRAYNAAGNSAYTPVAKITTPKPPPAPTALTAAAAGTAQIRLTWHDAATNESGYKIERSTDQKAWTLVATTAANAAAYTSGGLAARTTYYYRVRAYNLAGYSAFVYSAGVKTPAAATTVAAKAVAARGVFSDAVIGEA